MKNETLLLKSLYNVFNKDNYREQLFLITNGVKCVSLRSVDWFITNYSKKNNICYLLYETDDNKFSRLEKNIIIILIR